ncbi:unnamed protein product [Medioppia subpectinata]|uniref:LRRCT domain-containing protein n=1 Tax=Medioppia subpectinata TaxID=1979941 RepID=A0A7R9KTJ4_9ACAR|nr:unnamed protein product [Medioppia subpectinata]CAG2109547.1 unnamed protein product [Medioppia subpectinata]
MMCQMKTWMKTLLVVVLCLGVKCAAMCPRGCDCDDQRLRAVCEVEARLDYVPHTLNPALKQLILLDNQIRGVKSSLSVYRNLELLDISRNQLTTLGENNFLESNRIETMILNTNALTAVHNNTFNGLVSLKKLHLSDNKISEINSNTFKPLIGLETLDLSLNQIQWISGDAFRGLHNLNQLNLKSNVLNAIPSNSFQFVPKLQVLDLSQNSIHNISDDSFAPLMSLTDLYLEGCSLSAIDSHSFRRLTNLSTLRLNSNHLEEIPSKAFMDLTLLEELKIGDNYFKTISPKVFSSLQHLRTLDINKCQYLSWIELGSFDGLSHLERLEISHNKLLTNIDNNVLSDIPNLRYLTLRSNGFVTLQLEFVNTIERKIYLDVRDNPFHCNCSLEWLRHYLLQSNTSVTQMVNQTSEYISYPFLNLLGTVLGVECVSPPSLHTKLIVDLGNDEFGCFELDTKIPIIIAILIGVLLISGVMIIFVIRCKYGLSGLVKNQWLTGDNSTTNAISQRNDLNYRKPEFVFIPNIDLNIDETEGHLQETARYPLKMTPITEL